MCKVRAILMLSFLSVAAGCGACPEPVARVCPDRFQPSGSPDLGDASREPGGCGLVDRENALANPCGLASAACRWTEPFRFGTFPQGYALAATDEEVALAVWSGTTTAGPGCLRFARYGADLSTIMQSGCLGPTDATGVWLAATPSGWLAMIGPRSMPTDETSVQIFRLEQGGARMAPAHRIEASYRRIGSGLHFGGTLVQRPGAGPLAVWVDGERMVALMLREDGTPAGEPIQLSPSAPIVLGGAFVGDGFLLLRPGEQGLLLTHVPLEGGPPSDAHVAAGPGDMGSARLAWSRQAGYVMYRRDRRAFVVPVSSAGTALSEPAEIESPVDAAVFGPIAGIGDDVAILERDHGPRNALGEESPLRIVRVRGTTAVTPLQPVTGHRFPTYRDWYGIASMGEDVVVGWSATRCTSQYVALARLPLAVVSAPGQ
jgi:hypothetical protein